VAKFTFQYAHMHYAVYRFVESANNPHTDPVVLWLVSFSAVCVNVACVCFQLCVQ